PDGERDAGVGADERFLESHRIRRVLRDETGHSRVDRLQTESNVLAGRRRPAAVGDALEAPSAFLDDPVPARSRPRVDADYFHGQRLWTGSDDPVREEFRGAVA